MIDGRLAQLDRALVSGAWQSSDQKDS